jgi:hypothetical protein
MIGMRPRQVSTGGLDDLGILPRLQGEEFARATRGEERRRAVRHQPFEARGIRLGRELELGVEIGQREGEQAALQDLLQFGGFHGRRAFSR